ncbi:MAG TPA: YcaO-like family protein [Pyrinomonadaceae bacterium]|nr:YcaO-like family protein [Pyrinomonadaceae bacterium]
MADQEQVSFALPIVFVGPSIPLSEARQIVDAEFRAPCKRGDLAQLDSGTVVGLIDGVFHQNDAVSPREILYALQRGVTIFGSSSMGALRAAEVPGIQGVGHVYEMYQRGTIDSDDEVALVFDPERLVPLTIPLVNVRYAVDRLTQSGTITSAVGQRILSAAKQLHYTARTYPRILKEAGLSEKEDAVDLLNLLNSFDLKRDDARLLLERIANTSHRPIKTSSGDREKPVETRPDYGPADGFGRVRVANQTGAEAPVLIWEMGDAVPFPELVLFLKLTGSFDVHARNVLTRLRMRQELSSVNTAQGSQLEELKNDFHRLCRTWGWKTEEEVHVTMTDLGLGFRDVIKQLHDEALVARTVSQLALNADESFLDALRSELFFNDLALKREAMRCASLKSLGAGESVMDQHGETLVRQILGRLHNIAGWERLRAHLGDLGVEDSEVKQFSEMLVRARRRAQTIQSPTSTPQSHDAVDAEFGLCPAPKSQGEQRFSLPIAQSYEHAQRLRSLVNVTRIGMIDRLTELDGIHVSQVARPDGVWSSSYGSGKSESKEGAIVGGVMEETEKWAQERFTGEPLVSSYAALRKSENALDPKQLDLPYDSIYEENLEFAWHKCADLIHGRPIWVPLAALACSFNAGKNNIYYSARGARVTFSTNGLASGFTLAEALVHAACEYIERHAARMSELRVENPGLNDRRGWPRRVDLNTLPQPARSLVERLEKAGCRVGLWSISDEIRVPTFLARVDQDLAVARGTAAHPNPGIAAQMALLEAAQTIVAAVAAGREDLTVQARSLGRHERSSPLRAAANFFWQDESERRLHFNELEGLVTNDCYTEFKWVREKLIAAGVKHLIAVDLTREEMKPARAVRVILPGLESNNPYYCGPRARLALVSDMVSCEM